MKKLLIIILTAVAFMTPAAAQSRPEPIVTAAIESYTDWHDVEFSGKLKTDKLPVSPTVKLYMVRDSLIQISARVPLLGEVGRISIDPNRIVAVNKLKRVYADEPTQKLLDIYPGLISDIQSLLLARVVVLGKGELDESNAEMIEVEYDRAGGFMLIPDTSDSALDFNYGYLLDASARTAALIATLPSNISLELLYSYQNRGLNVDVSYQDSKTKFKGILEFNSVKWGGTPMGALKLMNYRQVSVKEFLSSLK